MRKILIFSVIVIMVGCGKKHTSDAVNLETILFERLSSTTKIEQYKACIFLAELALPEPLLNKIEVSQPKSTCKYYLLAKRTMLPKHKVKFIDHFPKADNQKTLWQQHRQAGYPVRFMPPYFDYLASLATTYDPALNVLILSLQNADGSVSESLNGSISTLYNKNKKRVLSALTTHKIKQKEIDYIIKTAAYL